MRLAGKRRQWNGCPLAIAVAALCGLALYSYSPASAASVSSRSQDRFQVTLEGVEDTALEEKLWSLASLTERKQRFLSTALLRRTAEADAENMREFLQAQGYFDAHIKTRITREASLGFVTYKVQIGTLYAVDGWSVIYLDPMEEDPRPQLEEMNISLPSEFTGQNFETVAVSALKYLREHGYPRANITTRYVEADRETKTAKAVIELQTGEHATFGDLVLANPIRTKKKYLDQLRTWDRGEEYSLTTVRAYQTRLAKTGLFQSISIDPGQTNKDGSTDIIANLVERKRRTIGTGLSFATDIGLGIKGYWQNRNLTGKNEKLTVTGSYSEKDRVLSTTFEQPWPRFSGTIKAGLAIEEEFTTGFVADSYEASIGFVRGWRDEHLKGSLGLSYEETKVTDTLGTERFTLYSFPGSLTWNNEDDALNPRKGFRATLALTPFFGDVLFQRVKLSGATRKHFGKQEKTTIALRAALGSIFGEDVANIPATERYYAGGGGSVRGFEYKSISPLNTNGEPVGGLSLVEMNVELRQQISPKWQFATFVDAGTVGDDAYPDFSTDPLIGAGVGARYSTPIGPLRFDIASPLNPRDDDAKVQFYISLGQSF